MFCKCGKRAHCRDSRTTPEGLVRRRYHCSACEAKFSSLEVKAPLKPVANNGLPALEFAVAHLKTTFSSEKDLQAILHAGSGISISVEAYRELEAENRDLMRISRELQIKLDTATVGRSQECEEQVIDAIRERRERGRRKYGTTMERDDLTPAQWAQHAQEEALDFAIYLERLKRIFLNPSSPLPA